MTVYNKFGMQAGIPVHGGKSISFRRMEAVLGASYAAAYNSGGAYASGPLVLTEGTPGAAMDATWVQILATVSQYGGYILYSDLAEDQSIDPIVAESTENFGEAMKEGLDLVTRDVVTAGSNVQYSSTSLSRGAVGSGQYLSLTELRRAKRTLLSFNAKVVAKEGKFVCITHPHALYDLEGDSNITNIWQYAGGRGLDTNQLFDTEIKDLPFGVRVYTTSLCRIFASLGLSGADVYGTVLFGDQWYGTINLEKMPAKVIVKERGSAGTADPLNQLMSIGWKAAHAAAVLNQNMGVRIEHASSSKNAS
jgi:N4-gp56 family major capsid protein